MKRINTAFIDELATRTDLVRLIGARVPLKKKGSNKHWACCPFHEEKTPSFAVDDVQQLYYCFGCGAGGNALQFLMDYDHLTFPEAVEQLAAFNGVSVQYDVQTDEQETRQAREKRDQGLLCLQEAAAFFAAALQDDNGRRSRAYLHSRGISAESIARFQIGYAPPGNALRAHLLPRYGEELLLATGLLGKAQDGHSFDWFRDRIIFPIHNVKGEVIAFGARALGDAMPKYLNSPETPWFSKRHELYGLYQALHGKQRGNTLLVSEGYMDVVKLAQHGMDQAVAALGTAIGDTHIAQLGKRASKVVFAFDGDSAGEKAAEKALDALFTRFEGKTEQCEWRFAFLPGGEDPDSLVEKRGMAAMHEVIDSSLTPSGFLLRLLDDGAGEARSVEAQHAVLAEAQSWLKKLPQGSYRQLLADALQSHFHFADGTLAEGLPIRSKRTRPAGKVAQESVRQATRADLRLLALLHSAPDFAFSACAEADALEAELPLFHALVYRICTCGEASARAFIAEHELEDKITALGKMLADLPHDKKFEEFNDMVAQVLARRSQREGRLEKLRLGRI